MLNRLRAASIADPPRMAISRTSQRTERRYITLTVAFGQAARNGTYACSRRSRASACGWALIGFVVLGHHDTMFKSFTARRLQRERGGGR